MDKSSSIWKSIGISMVSIFIIVLSVYSSGYRLSVGDLEEDYFKNYGINDYEKVAQFQDGKSFINAYDTENHLTFLYFKKDLFLYHFDDALYYPASHFIVDKEQSLQPIRLNRDVVVLPQSKEMTKVVAVIHPDLDYPRNSDTGDESKIRKLQLEPSQELFYVIKLSDYFSLDKEDFSVYFYNIKEDGSLEIDENIDRYFLNKGLYGAPLTIVNNGEVLKDTLEEESNYNYSNVRVLDVFENDDVKSIFDSLTNFKIAFETMEYHYDGKDRFYYCDGASIDDEYGYIVVDDFLINEFLKQFNTDERIDNYEK